MLSITPSVVINKNNILDVFKTYYGVSNSKTFTPPYDGELLDNFIISTIQVENNILMIQDIFKNHDLVKSALEIIINNSNINNEKCGYDILIFCSNFIKSIDNKNYHLKTMLLLEECFIDDNLLKQGWLLILQHRYNEHTGWCNNCIATSEMFNELKHLTNKYDWWLAEWLRAESPLKQFKDVYFPLMIDYVDTDSYKAGLLLDLNPLDLLLYSKQHINTENINSPLI